MPKDKQDISGREQGRPIVRENGTSGLKDFQKGDCYAKEKVVQMHVGTVCGHNAFAGMEHAVSIGTGKRGNHGKVRGCWGRYKGCNGCSQCH